MGERIQAWSIRSVMPHNQGDGLRPRAGHASHGAGSRLRHPVTIAIAAAVVWAFNISMWWIV